MADDVDARSPGHRIDIPGGVVPEESLRGCRALVTGSSGGIGRHIALGLASLGVDVAFNYRTHPDAAAEAVRVAESMGVRALALPADCADREQVRRLVEQAAGRLGGLEILVNNVGEFAYKRLRAHEPDEFDRIIAGTVGTTFHATIAALPYMRSAGFGRVVNIGAAGAEVAIGGRREGPHLAGKAGVLSLTRSFAIEEARHGVTFNAVCPGVVEDRDLTRQEALGHMDRGNPVGRPGTSADVVDAVLLLCRRESSFINGAVIAVTGGWQGYLGPVAHG